MSDFFEQFGQELRAAHVRSTEDSAERTRHRGSRRFFVGLAAACAVAAPALAITQPWSPDLHRPSIDQPVATSEAPVTDQATSALAVLRRAQTQADRDGTAGILSAIGAGNQVSGVQTGGIRALRDGWALVPAEEVRAGDRTLHGQLCFTDGQTVTCGSASKLTTSGIGGSEASQTETVFTGLVPDTVTTVRFTSTSGAVVTTKPTSNFYELRVGEVAPKGTINGPDGSPIPAPPLPVQGQLQWLNNEGAVIGPRP